MHNRRKNVLVSGASFAGLATAFWMTRLGYRVTVVELNRVLKRGGTPVNIQEGTIEVVRRMGLLDQVLSNKISMEVMEFKNAADVTERSDSVRQQLEQHARAEYEIERDVLLNMMFEAVKDDVEFIFGDSLRAVEESNDSIRVTLRSGATRVVDLLFGCDGIHSVVRKLCFGEEAEFSHFLSAYFAISIVDRSLIPTNTIQMYNEPGKMVMLNAYNNKTDIVLVFHSEQQIPYDYRNEHQQRNILLSQFAQVGWRTPELLAEMNRSETFYFDKLCQIRMPSWTKGRVALVGDAGYCASPAAGRGGSLALDGAAALADAFHGSNGDYELAFREYNQSFRPFIEQLQESVAAHGLEALLPRTEQAIRERNSSGTPFLQAGE